jgi:hypothetical protein
VLTTLQASCDRAAGCTSSEGLAWRPFRDCDPPMTWSATYPLTESRGKPPGSMLGERTDVRADDVSREKHSRLHRTVYLDARHGSQ